MRRLLVPGAIVAIGFAVLIIWQRQARSAEHPPATGFTAQLLDNQAFDWQTQEFKYGHLHFLQNSHASKTTDYLIEAVDTSREYILRSLNLEADTAPTELFFVDTRDQMADLVGRPIGGMVKSGERNALFVYNAGYKPFVKHELTHLYSHYHWGQPRNGRWITEGLAALITWECQGHTVFELAAGFERDGKLVEWAEFVLTFDQQNEITANIQAATMVRIVINYVGLDGFRELWQSAGWDAFLARTKKSLQEHEAEWRRSLRVQPVARLDTLRLRNEGC